MKTVPSRRKSSRLQGLTFAGVVALGLVFSGGMLLPRPAQALACANCSTWVADLLKLPKEIAGWAADKAAWLQQARDMQQMISDIQNMQLSLGLQNGQEMEEIPNPKEFLVKERCGEPGGGGTGGGGGGGGFVGGIIGSLTGINLKGKVFEEQYKICARKQWLENEKYNVGVRYLKRSMQQMDSDYRNLLTKFASAKNVGNSNKVNQDANAVLIKNQAQQQNHEQLIAAYDAAIASLDGQKGALSRAAMRGNTTLISTMASTAAAYTALCSGGRCKD